MPFEPIRANPGQQSAFLETKADIALYGGAKGGGKTRGLLIEALRHIGNPGWGPVIFRRTYSEIFQTGGLWEESKKFYRLARGVPREGDVEWRFPSGATIKFRHMQNEDDKETWDGAQIPLIGWDELVSFTQTQFWYLLSRNRSTCGVRPYVRATCNPDSESWVANLIEWWIDQDTGYPIQERSGVVRWFMRDDEKLVWADSWSQLHKLMPNLIAPPGKLPDGVTEKRVKPLSFTFIPARLDDNPPLERADPEYRAKLMMQPLIERERWLQGNWKIRPSAGLKFPHNMWNTKFAIPPPGLRLLRFWDKAYTEGGKGARTAGVLLGELPKTDALRLGLPAYWVVDVIAGRWGDAERESRIRTTAELDRKKYGYVTIGIEREGGAGKHSANMTVENLAGFDVYTEHPMAKKHLRWSNLASQQQIGNVAIVKGEWDWGEFIRELDALAGDEQLDKNKLRDCADAAAGAFKGLTDRGSQLVGDVLASGDPNEDDHSPLTNEELADESTPEWLRDMISDSREHRYDD